MNKAIQAKADQDKADALAELQKALDKAKATDKTNCTPESVKNLDDAINKGQEVVNHSNEVSIDSIKAAEKAIQDALKALEVDKASDSGKDTENVKRPTVKAVEKTSDKVNKKSEGSKAETKAKSKELPKTGLESPVDPKYATLMFAIGGLMALFGRRKKEDKDSTEK